MSAIASARCLIITGSILAKFFLGAKIIKLKQINQPPQKPMLNEFDNWNKIKQQIDKKSNPPTFKEREIWWCSIGLNIGHEENGKNKDYSRPVLIIRKFNNHLFWGVPLTTQIKEKYYYHKINLKEKQQCAMLSQKRPYTSKRLINKMGKLSDQQFEEIKNALKEMIN